MKKILLLLFVSMSFAVLAQDWRSGTTYLDENKWTEFLVGNMPLVITVPHGGYTNPLELPDRDCRELAGNAKFVTATDTRTVELAKAIDSVFKRDYGFRPYLVICHLRRKKIDQNREIDIATCGNEEMKKVWYTWHNWADTAIALATKKYGQTMYIDLHAHGHTDQRLELGYTLTTEELQAVQEGAENTSLIDKVSIRNFFKQNPKKVSLKEMLSGKNSFGTWMAESGFRSIPSADEPVPYAGDKYFNGGYNVRRYTMLPNVIGWQIETNNKGVRDSEENYYAFAEAFVKNIMRFITTYTKINASKIGK
jgi:hypothetical protein